MPIALSEAQFGRIYRRLKEEAAERGSDRGVDGITDVDRQQALHVLICAGKNIRLPDFDRMWPAAKERISLEETFELFTTLETVDLESVLDAQVPMDILTHKLSMMDLKADERIEITRYLNTFEKEGLFHVDKFTLDTECTRVQLLQSLIHNVPPLKLDTENEKEKNGDKEEEDEDNDEEEEEDYDNDYEAKEPSLNEETTLPTGQPEPRQWASRQRGRGYLLIGRKIYSLGFKFTIQEENADQELEISIEIIRNCDMSERAFANDLFGVISELDSGRILHVTRELTNGMMSTGPIRLPAGIYQLTVACFGCTVELIGRDNERGEDKYRVVDMLTEGGSMQKKFKSAINFNKTFIEVTLMNIFDIFDVDEDGRLRRDEFELFSMISENKEGDFIVSEKFWRDLAECFGFDAEKGMPMSEFIRMYQLELNGGIEDVAIGIRNLGFDGNFRLKQCCPYAVHILSDSSVPVYSRLVESTKPAREAVMNFFHELATPLDDPSESGLPVRLYRAAYYAVLTCDCTGREGEDTFVISITSEICCKKRPVQDIDSFIPCDHHGIMYLAFFAATNPSWDVSVEFTKKSNSER